MAEKVFGIAKKRGARVKDLKLVHMSDNAMRPHNKIFDSYYYEWEVVFRNYWWNETFLKTQRRNRHLYWFPLGYSSHILKPPMPDIPSIHRREHLLSFVGNTGSGNMRRGNHILEIQETLNITVAGTVRSAEFGVGSENDYRDVMLKSKFCLNIRGRFVECYRLYDALELGCIPVIVDVFARFNYTLQHSEQMAPLIEFPWTDTRGSRRIGPPFVWTRTVTDLKYELARLQTVPDEVERIAADSKAWWEQMKHFHRVLFRDQLCTSMPGKVY